VTRLQTPDGRVVAATYDSPRGRLVRVVDSTFEGTGTTQPVTTDSLIYGQSTAPDSPTELRTPVDTTKFAYDPTLGLTDSVIAPGGYKTKFRYFLTGTQRGLVQKVIDRGVRIVDTSAWTRSFDSLVTSFTYDHWGNDSTITTPKQVASIVQPPMRIRAESQQAPGLSFYRNRYYDQNTGRWTQEDPVGIAGGINLYSYVGNNPAVSTDPFGLKADTVIADEKARQETNACVNASQACAELIHRLAEDPGRYVISTGPLPDSLNAGDNRIQFTFGANGVVNAVTGAQITIDPRHFGAASVYLTVPSTYGTNLVHELGHVVGTLNMVQSGVVQSNRDPGCDQRCAIFAENAYRRQVGLGLRPLTRP